MMFFIASPVAAATQTQPLPVASLPIGGYLGCYGSPSTLSSLVSLEGASFQLVGAFNAGGNDLAGPGCSGALGIPSTGPADCALKCSSCAGCVGFVLLPSSLPNALYTCWTKSTIASPSTNTNTKLYKILPVTVESCVQGAINAGHPFAILANGNTCLVPLVNYPLDTLTAIDGAALCTSPCTGNSLQACGGVSANSLYATGNSTACSLSSWIGGAPLPTTLAYTSVVPPSAMGAYSYTATTSDVGSVRVYYSPIGNQCTTVG